MKKFLLACCILFVVSSASYASIEVSLSPGFAGVGMEKLNSYLTRLLSDRSLLGLSDNKKTADIEYGMCANLDLMFGMIPGISLGARAGYVFCPQGTVENDNTALNSGIISRFDTYLIPLMLGMTLSVPVPKTNFTITAGGFGGYGFAGLKETQDNTVLGFFGSGNVTYLSGGFTSDVYIGFNYKLAGFFSLGANVCYRAAFITGFKAGADSSNTVQLNVLKGAELNDPDGNPIPVDYSGANAEINIKFEF